jgi:hypothetical protein
MRMRGLEPPPSFLDTDLNRARLPIPPHPRAVGSEDIALDLHPGREHGTSVQGPDRADSGGPLGRTRSGALLASVELSRAAIV